ncbi:MAG: hypothetical protein HC933_11550 [Pleurocapsa sp. SU_196_0]|nr:hypothetical protein [Pleurocapsa sp. SU_196_0]
MAEVSSTDRTVTMTLTYPTGLTAFADTDKNGSLSSLEITQHQSKLEAVLGAKIGVSSGEGAGNARGRACDGGREVPEASRVVRTRR